MKQQSGFLTGCHSVLIAATAVFFVASPARAILTTNSYVNAAGVPWDTGVIGTWSAGAPAIGNAACVISNTGIKTVFIIDTTSASSLIISNLLLGAPPGGSANTLTLFTTNTLTVLQNVIVGSGGTINMSNSTIDVRGLSGGFVVDNGSITITNRATFIATNALSGLDIGHGGTGTFAVNGGRLLIMDEEVGTFAGDVGTLTLFGGTNQVLSDGLFIGDNASATGVVWITGGTLVETNTSIYVGNLGSGRMAVSNGLVAAEQLIIGNSGVGTLTVAGGTVVTPDFGLISSLILGSGAGGTGTMWVTSGSVVSTNPATTRIGDSGAGTFVVSNGTVSLWRANLGHTAGAGTLSVVGGTVKLTGAGVDFSLGLNASTRGSVKMIGGELLMTNDVSDNVFIGDAGIGDWTQNGGTGRVVDVVLANGASSVGTLTVSSGLLTGSGSITVGEGSSSTGRVWLSGGTLLFTNAVTLVADPASSVGAITISNGTTELGAVTVGVFGSGALTIAGGTLHSEQPLTLAGNSSATANFTQSGGSLIASNGTSTGTGIVNIQSTGGTWLGGGLSFGFGNPGTFTVNGGTNILNGLLTAGSSSGSGSVWVISGNLVVTNGTTSIGSGGFGQFTATGGVAQLRDVSIGTSSPVGLFTVAGGSVTFATTLSAGFSGSGTLTVSSGGLAVGGDSTLGGFGGTGVLKVGGGTMTAQGVTLGIFGGTGKLFLTGGALTLTNLIAVSGPSSSISFSAGTLNSSSTAVTNTAQFVVGDGVSAAHFRLLGGRHSFNNGLRIRNSATLSGCGTVSATVLVDTGGTVVADCGGLLTFTGSVTNNGLMKATGGSTLEFYGTVVNNGVIDTIFGNTNFHGAFINNGILLDAGGDYDGDGQSNLAETLAGTDPTNSASALRVTGIARTNNDVLISWTMGSGKTNALQRTSGDTSGNFNTNNFADIFIITNTVGTSTNRVDDAAATNAPSLYYRVRLVP